MRELMEETGIVAEPAARPGWAHAIRALGRLELADPAIEAEPRRNRRSVTRNTSGVAAAPRRATTQRAAARPSPLHQRPSPSSAGWSGGQTPPRYSRLAVVGDSDFAANYSANIPGNVDMFLSIVRWLTMRPSRMSLSFIARQPAAFSIRSSRSPRSCTGTGAGC